MSGAYEYAWSEAKRATNLERHGVDFADADRLDWDRAITVDQNHHGEVRHLTYAPLAGRLHAIVWTDRDGVMRIISFRKANERERRKYEHQTK